VLEEDEGCQLLSFLLVFVTYHVGLQHNTSVWKYVFSIFRALRPRDTSWKNKTSLYQDNRSSWE